MSNAATVPEPSRHGFIPAKGGPFAWRSIDLVTAAVLGVALGVAFWGFDLVVYPGLSAALVYPPAGSLLLGVWLLPAVAGGLLVRRPGAALITEMLAANVEMLLGNQWGAAVLLSGLLQAIGVEVVLALLLWRRFGLLVAMLAGAASAVFELIGYEWWVSMVEYTWTQRVIALGFAVVSGIVIAGLGGWALVRGLSATGVVNAFPPGQEYLAAHIDDEDLDAATPTAR